MEIIEKPHWIPQNLWHAYQRERARAHKAETRDRLDRLVGAQRLGRLYDRLDALLPDGLAWAALLDTCDEAATWANLASQIRHDRAALLEGYRRIERLAAELSGLIDEVRRVGLKAGSSPPMELGLVPELIECAAEGGAEYRGRAQEIVHRLMRVHAHELPSTSLIVATIGRVAMKALTDPMGSINPALEAAVQSQKHSLVRSFARAFFARAATYEALTEHRLGNLELGELAQVALGEPARPGAFTADELAEYAAEQVRGARRGGVGADHQVFEARDLASAIGQKSPDDMPNPARDDEAVNKGVLH